MFIANISQFLAVNLSTGGAFMNSSGKCVLFLDAPALHKHVDMCRASKCWGETWPILGLKVSLVASSDMRGKVKLVSVQRWKDICLGVPVALSKVSIFLWNFLQRFRHSSNPIMKNLAPESWNIPAIPSRAWGGSVRRSWQLTTRSLLFPWFLFLFSWLLFFFSSPFFSWLLSSLLLSWELFLFLCPFSGLVFLIFSSICNREFRPLHFDYTYKPMGFEGFKCLPQ